MEAKGDLPEDVKRERERAELYDRLCEYGTRVGTMERGIERHNLEFYCEDGKVHLVTLPSEIFAQRQKARAAKRQEEADQEEEQWAAMRDAKEARQQEALRVELAELKRKLAADEETQREFGARACRDDFDDDIPF